MAHQVRMETLPGSTEVCTVGGSPHVSGKSVILHNPCSRRLRAAYLCRSLFFIGKRKSSLGCGISSGIGTSRHCVVSVSRIFAEEGAIMPMYITEKWQEVKEYFGALPQTEEPIIDPADQWLPPGSFRPHTKPHRVASNSCEKIKASLMACMQTSKCFKEGIARLNLKPLGAVTAMRYIHF